MFLQVWMLEKGTRFVLRGDDRVFVHCGYDDSDLSVVLARESGCVAVTRIDGDCYCVPVRG